MKRLTLALAVAAVLVLPSAALAKGELTNVAVCGPDGCNNISGPGNLRDFPAGGEPDWTIPGPAAYYEVRFTAEAEGGKHEWTAWYVPSAGELAARDQSGIAWMRGIAWMPIDDAAMAKATKGVKPFPKPRITEVLVGSKRVTDDPESYFRLYTVESAGNAVPSGLADWQPVTFRSERESPWRSPASSSPLRTEWCCAASRS